MWDGSMIVKSAAVCMIEAAVIVAAVIVTAVSVVDDLCETKVQSKDTWGREKVDRGRCHNQAQY